ncbi:MAG: YebC/PmpR family DNA-binding transcriptional regulator [Ignavibacteriae bacterium HGW-Ignavibacteriae-4]|jgi:YebC/PmpR family DNA-binding regulatory protein|nr:MAG: YebC/PmpR family DNA-binding transcriptional regulator [Ignavibacteriae bacterium HGW-Ignavibacteriae-4]
MAGHSKWANIKHRKGRQDALKGKIFTQMGKEITISAREGGGDTDMNPRLRLAVKKARDNDMPKDNIERAIKKGTGELEGQAFEEYRYEGYGPGGVAIIVETISDNKNRTVAEVRASFNKYDGNMGETNSVAWNFDRKGVVTIKSSGASEEDLMMETLEAGGEDVDYDTDSSRIICTLNDYNSVNEYFDKSIFEIEDSQLEYIPKNKVKITDVSTAKKVMLFLDKMEEVDDVQNVYNNADIDDSVIDQLDL